MTLRREKRAVRGGLTLLELVIVMTILVALAGIAVGMFPRLMGRAHIASCSANLPELTKAIQMYEATSMDGYPDMMDNLIDGDGIASILPLRNGEIRGLETHDLTDDEARALQRAGINNLAGPLADPGTGGDFHPSFWPYAQSVPDAPVQPVDEGLEVARLRAWAAQTEGISTNGDEDVFVVFGLGSPCRMFGRTINEAPVHFSDGLEGNPNERYMRFVAVFQVAGHVANPDYIDEIETPGEDEFIPSVYRRARFRGVLSMHPGRLEGVGSHMEEYWEEVEADQVQ